MPQLRVDFCGGGDGLRDFLAKDHAEALPQAVEGDAKGGLGNAEAGGDVGVRRVGGAAGEGGSESVEGGAEGGGEVAALNRVPRESAEFERVDVVVDAGKPQGVGVDPGGEEQSAAGHGRGAPGAFMDFQDIGLQPAAGARLEAVRRQFGFKAAGVGVLQRVAQRGNDGEGFARGEAAGGEEAAEVHAVHEFHEE